MTQCHVTWDSYKKNLRDGFSHLQQQEELVDMTLAADGHLVKVHKNLLALSSPYLKAIIQSASCQHPVIFLTHISHEILCYIVEYVYTGEVVVPSENMCKFIEAAKALKVHGLCNLLPPTKVQKFPPAQKGSNVEKNKNNINNILIKKKSDKNTHSYPMENILKSGIASDHTEIPNLSNICQRNNLETYLLGRNEAEQLLLHNQNGNNNLSNTIINVPNISQSMTQIPQTSAKMSIIDIYPENENNEVECSDMDLDTIVEDNVYGNMDTADRDEVFENTNHSFEESCGTTPIASISNVSSATKNYSINVEMPDGKIGPPKITIQAEVTDNMPIVTDTIQKKEVQEDVYEKVQSISEKNPKIIINAGKILNIPNILPKDGNTMEDNVCENILCNDNSIPQITISAGNGQDAPSLSIKKIASSIEYEKSKTALTDLNAASPLYMITAKGSLQMILNRFIYGIHFTSKQGKRIRWRCIDYRHKCCPAYIDSFGEVIVNRKFVHNHSLHDEQILNRGSRKQVYESLGEASKALENR